MAVDLIKPDPDDNQAVAAVVELAPNTADAPPLLQRAWSRLLQEGEPAASVGRAVVFPSLRPYLITRSDLGTARTGALLIFRSSWALARRTVAMAAALAHKIRNAEAPDEEPDKAKDGKPDEKASAKGKKSKKKAKDISIDMLIGGAILVGMAWYLVKGAVIPLIFSTVENLAAWVAGHPILLLRVTGVSLIVFVPVAWIIGQAAAEQTDVVTEQGEAAEQTSEEVVEEAPEDGGEALLAHVVLAMADTQSARRTGMHLDAILAAAITKKLVPPDTEVPDLREWLEACGLPVDPKFGRRIGGKSVTRVGLRVDAVTTALGMPPAAWLEARSEARSGAPASPLAGAPAEGSDTTPVQPVEEPPISPLDKTPEAPTLRVISGAG